MEGDLSAKQSLRGSTPLAASKDKESLANWYALRFEAGQAERLCGFESCTLRQIDMEDIRTVRGLIGSQVRRETVLQVRILRPPFITGSSPVGRGAGFENQ